MDMGILIPRGNNVWLISTTSPQCKPSFELDETGVRSAERFGERIQPLTHCRADRLLAAG